jgi:hypothetical protein
MTNKKKSKTYPTHRVSFSARLGTDEDGGDVLGPAREIGAVWPRKGEKKGGILRFDHTPREPGVYFIVPLDDAEGEDA